MRFPGFPLDKPKDQWQEPDLKGGGSPQYPLALTNWGAWTPSGGVAFSATADHARGKVPAAPTGGFTLGGAAATQFYTSRAWTPAGGLTFGGAATTSYVSGGAGAGGTSYVAPTPTGGVAFSGAATTSYVAVVLVPTGTVLFDDLSSGAWFDYLITYPQAAGQATTTPAESPAGGRRRVREIYRVTVDGQKFEFRSLVDALAFLDKAQKTALLLAQEAARRATEAQAESARRLPPPALKTPEIGISSRELRRAAAETKRAIEQIYQAAVRDAEIAMLLAVEAREEENEDAFLLLM